MMFNLQRFGYQLMKTAMPFSNSKKLKCKRHTAEIKGDEKNSECASTRLLEFD